MIPVSNDTLATIALGLHGPLDLATTGAAYILGLFHALEGNPLVLELGIGRWLAINTGAIVAFAPAYWIAREHTLTRPLLWVLVLLGLLIVPNVAILGLEVIGP